MASAGGAVTRAHHARYSSASVAVIPAERFAVLSFSASVGSAVSSPVAARADDPVARRAESAASPSAPPLARPSQAAQAAGESVPVLATGGSECAAEPDQTTEPLTTSLLAAPTTNKDDNCASASQFGGGHGGGAASEPPTRAAASNPLSSGYGLSLQQLQHLVALTNANDTPRDAAAAFPYAATSDGRSRLSINSAQRRLESWNRAREPVFENSIEHIRAQRKLKRSGSDPSLRESARGGKDSLGGPSRPLEGVVSEARKVAMRRWLRRSRSAHTLGEKDAATLWNEAMKAIIWGRGGAVVFRRPAGGISQARPSGGERLGNGSTQSSGAGNAAGNAARYNSASTLHSHAENPHYASPHFRALRCGTLEIMAPRSHWAKELVRAHGAPSRVAILKRGRSDNHDDYHSDGAACTNARHQRRVFRTCASSPAAPEPMGTILAASSDKAASSATRSAAEMASTAITQQQGGPMMQGAVTRSDQEGRSMRLSWADYVRSKESQGITVLSDKHPPSDAASDCSAEARSDLRAVWVEQCATGLMEQCECTSLKERASYEKLSCTHVVIPDLNLPACDDFGLATHCQVNQLGVPVTAPRTFPWRHHSWRQAMMAPVNHHALYSPFVTHSQRCASRYIHVSAARANVTHETAQSPPVAEPLTTPDAHAQTSPAISAWPAFSAAFSGEWAGYSVDFSRFGDPLELPQSVVPEAFRDWGLVQYAWQSQTSSAARGETLGNGSQVLSSLVRYAPAAGCEAASPPKYSVERTALELSAAAPASGGGAASAAGDLFAFSADGSYLQVRAGQSSTMPAPASVDAMRATQWMPRGTDSRPRGSNSDPDEGDSNEGIGSMAGGPFQVEHCLALEGVEAASGKGRVRVRVVQQFKPENAAAGGRGGGREGRRAGAVAMPRLASLALHREKWVEPFSGGAELADGAALFSAEMIEEGEGSEAVREGRVKEIEGRWEATTRTAQVPTAPAVSPSLVALELTKPIQTDLSRHMETSALEDGMLMILPEGVWSHVHKVDELSGEDSFCVEAGWLFASSQAIVSRVHFDQSGNVKSQTAGALGFPQIAWGDSVAFMTTGIHDTDVKRYVVDIPAQGQPTWSQLPSIGKPKGAYFSGFEVSFDFHGVVEDAALRLYELIGMVTVLQSQGAPKAAPCIASGSMTHRSWNLDCVVSYEEGSKDDITVKAFKDWSPLLDGSSLIMALSESNLWKSFGISIADAAIHSFFGIFHTEKSYMEKHLNIYLHLHSQHISSAKSETVPRKILLKLVKDAVIASLQQLKTQLPGQFSSVHQAKVGSCLPDLATSIAALVAGSSNTTFQEECSNILGVEDVKDVEAAILQRLSLISLTQ
ncbi:unnamed protein product [Closterium sp. Yama58-4]|nr:unnamed protein product [Closterium sp. Yama58-4]